MVGKMKSKLTSLGMIALFVNWFGLVDLNFDSSLHLTNSVYFKIFLFSHLPFLAGILAFRPPGFGFYSIMTASYSDEGLVALTIVFSSS